MLGKISPAQHTRGLTAMSSTPTPVRCEPLVAAQREPEMIAVHNGTEVTLRPRETVHEELGTPPWSERTQGDPAIFHASSVASASASHLLIAGALGVVDDIYPNDGAFIAAVETFMAEGNPSELLYLKPSGVPGMGFGVHAQQDLDRGTILCFYAGRTMPMAELSPGAGEYAHEIGAHYCVDAIGQSCYGRFMQAAPYFPEKLRSEPPCPLEHIAAANVMTIPLILNGIPVSVAIVVRRIPKNAPALIDYVGYKFNLQIGYWKSRGVEAPHALDPMTGRPVTVGGRPVCLHEHTLESIRGVPKALLSMGDLESGVLCFMQAMTLKEKGKRELESTLRMQQLASPERNLRAEFINWVVDRNEEIFQSFFSYFVVSGSWRNAILHADGTRCTVLQAYTIGHFFESAVAKRGERRPLVEEFPACYRFTCDELTAVSRFQVPNVAGLRALLSAPPPAEAAELRTLLLRTMGALSHMTDPIAEFGTRFQHAFLMSETHARLAELCGLAYAQENGSAKDKMSWVLRGCVHVKAARHLLRQSERDDATYAEQLRTLDTGLRARLMAT